MQPDVYIQATRGRINPTHMYYRQPNGWITVEAGTVIERAKFAERGWTPLRDYPMFDMGHVWCADNPLATLFQFGGAKELPLDQIIAMGFYYNPPTAPVCRQPQTERHNHTRDCYQGAQPVHFPQLEGVQIDGPFPCHFCDRMPLPTIQGLRQHEEVAHKAEQQSIRSGETLASSLIEGFGGRISAPVSDNSDPLAVFAAAGIKLLPWQLDKLREAGVSVKEPEDAS
jgi:hypothetical protein